MKHTDIAALFRQPEAYLGQEVTVCGWVRTSAEVKPMAFIQINDGTTSTTNLQLTIHQERMSEQEYRDRLIYCVMEFVVNRLSLLRIVSDSIPIDFIETLLVNSNRLMDLL